MADRKSRAYRKAYFLKTIVKDTPTKYYKLFSTICIERCVYFNISLNISEEEKNKIVFVFTTKCIQPLPDNF